jgi:hypothetical protein
MIAPKSYEERNRPTDPDCPHGGPYLTDSMMEQAYRVAERIDREANRKGRVEFKFSAIDEGGGIWVPQVGHMRATIARMQAYIKSLEADRS